MPGELGSAAEALALAVSGVGVHCGSVILTAVTVVATWKNDNSFLNAQTLKFRKPISFFKTVLRHSFSWPHWLP